jgi:hypothetical protein
VYGANYTWTVPNGVGIVSGQGSNTLVVNFLPNFSQGNICVKANNGCGSTANSCLSVVAKPSGATIINGPVGVCRWQKDVIYSVAPVFGVTNYTWTVPNGAVITSGQGTPTIAVTFGTRAGNISVKTSNACGNGTSSTLSTFFICREAFSAVSYEDIILYPNPAHSRLNVRFIAPESATGQFQIIDLSGRILSVEDIQILEGENLNEFNLEKLVPGIYFMVISAEGMDRTTLRFIVQ